jgi:hypothetical protein
MKIHAANEKAQHAPKRVSYFAFPVREGGRVEGEITIGTPEVQITNLFDYVLQVMFENFFKKC